MQRFGSLEVAMRQNDLAFEVRDYLESVSYTHLITLDQLADVIHMNKFYLTHTFRKTYGMAPIAYMIGKRIEESKYLLENTDFSLSQISDIVGFSSPSYFRCV